MGSDKLLSVLILLTGDHPREKQALNTIPFKPQGFVFCSPPHLGC